MKMAFSTVAGLSGEEETLVTRLREIPDGVARSELVRLVRRLLDFVRDPRCPESQADGVPCACVSGDCEQCQQVAVVLRRLHQQLRQV
jgi:hypothetical protein